MMRAEGTARLDVVDGDRFVGSVRMEAITRLIAPDESPSESPSAKPDETGDESGDTPVPVSEDAAGG
jgi:hypothetical protein